MAATMPTGKRIQSGFTYLFVLMLIALIGMGLAAAGSLWHTDAQRAREAKLLFIGDQYRQAIRSYYELYPAQPRLPQSIDELLEDSRRPDTIRHLRRAYRDPFTGGEFALIRSPDSKGIVGVNSTVTGRPFKTSGFLPEDASFVGAANYADWRFVFMPPATSGDQGGTLSATASSQSDTASATNSSPPDTATATPPPSSGVEVPGEHQAATVRCRNSLITLQQYQQNGCPH